MKHKPRIAVLGAGIMGCSLALFLARKGAQVTLFDAADQPFSGASRWNEGKIHLGFLYSADPSMRTADHVALGGLRFRGLVEELLACSIASTITAADDFMLCHRQSVVSPDAMETYFQRLSQRVRTHPDANGYLAAISERKTHRLTATELAALTDSPDIVAGFQVPERSVETTWIADRFVEAVAAESRIEPCMNALITAVSPVKNNIDGTWQVETSAGTFAPYDYVINALWQGRLAIDQTAGLAPAGAWSHRYRQSIFLRTTVPVAAPCVVIATGPFGDIKNYNGRDFYLSWYPDGLRVDSSEVLPPPVESLVMPDPQQQAASIFNNLENFLPWVADIREKTERLSIEGGWVFAAGRGLLSDPSSTLHQRRDFGAVRRGGYISVDTGKYSTAPWLARSISDALF